MNDTVRPILLVEDNETILRAGRLLLESLGYQVLAAANGHKALEIHQTEKVDLVLTDVVMPEMGGKELIRALRKTNPDQRVLAITGYILAKDLQELKAEGVHDVIHKPLDPDTLARTVRNALDSD